MSLSDAAQYDLGNSQKLWREAKPQELAFKPRGGRPVSWEEHGRDDADAILGMLEGLPWRIARQKALDFGCGDGRVGTFLRQKENANGGFEYVAGVDFRPASPEPPPDPPPRRRRWRRRRRHSEDAKPRNVSDQLDHYVPLVPSTDGTLRPPQVDQALQMAVEGPDELEIDRERKFDLVVSLFALQHNPPEVAEVLIEQLISMLQPGGVLYFDLRDHREHGLTSRVMAFRGRTHGRGPAATVFELEERRVERVVSRTSAYIHSVYRDASTSPGAARYVYVVVRPRHDKTPQKETEARSYTKFGNILKPDLELGAEVLKAQARSRQWILRRDTAVEFVDDVIIQHEMQITVSPAAYYAVSNAPKKRDKPRLLPLALLSKNLLTDLEVTDADGRHVPWLIRRYNNWVAWSVLVTAAGNVLNAGRARRRPLSREIESRLSAVAYADHRRARAIIHALQEEAAEGATAWQRDLARLLADEYFAKLLFDLAYNWILLVEDNGTSPQGDAWHFVLRYVECLQWNPWHAVEGHHDTFTTFYGAPFTLFDRSRRWSERRRILWQCAQMATGLLPIRIVLAAPSFAECQSFHFAPAAPPGLKLVAARLHVKTVDGRRWVWHGAAGGQKGHVYAKPRAWSYAGKVELVLVSRPRGSAQLAMFAGITSAIILSSVLFFLDNVINNRDAQTAVALLVALPGLLAAILARPDEHETSEAFSSGVRGLLGLVVVDHVLAGLALLGQSKGMVLAAWLVLTAFSWVLALTLTTAAFEPLREMRRTSRRRVLSPTATLPARCRRCGKQIPLHWDGEEILDVEDFTEAFSSDAFLFLAPSAEGQRAGFRDARTVQDATEAASRTSGITLGTDDNPADDLPRSQSTYPPCTCTSPVPRPEHAPIEHEPRIGSFEHSMRWVVFAGFALLADLTIRGVYGYTGPFYSGGQVQAPLAGFWIAAGSVALGYGWWRAYQRQRAIDRARTYRFEPDKPAVIPPLRGRRGMWRKVIRYRPER